MMQTKRKRKKRFPVKHAASNSRAYTKEEKKGKKASLNNAAIIRVGKKKEKSTPGVLHI